MFTSDVCTSPLITCTSGGDPRNDCRNGAFADRLEWEEQQTRIVCHYPVPAKLNSI